MYIEQHILNSITVFFSIIKVIIIAQFLNLNRPAQVLHLQPFPDGLHSHRLKFHDGQMLSVDIIPSYVRLYHVKMNLDDAI